jgi:hypothetical protein
MEDTSHLHIEFFVDPVENPAKTRDAGRPIFEDKEFVRIRFVGDRNKELVAPANDPFKFDREKGRHITYAEEFPRHYEAFKRDQEYVGEGTPLKEVPWLTASKRKELESLNIHTVESLSRLDGSNLARLGVGNRELKMQAVAWLDKAAGAAQDSKLAAELAARDDQIEQLKQQMAEMSARMKPFDHDKNGAPGGAAPAEEGAYASYSLEDLKNIITDRTGSRPKGNPSKATLIRSIEELNEAEKAK